MRRPSSTLNLIYENVKYSTTVTKTSAQSYAFVLYNSFLEVNLQPLVDGGSLIRFGTESHLTYVKEEVRFVSTCCYWSAYSIIRISFMYWCRMLCRLIDIGWQSRESPPCLLRKTILRYCEQPQQEKWCDFMLKTVTQLQLIRSRIVVLCVIIDQLMVCWIDICGNGSHEDDSPHQNIHGRTTTNPPGWRYAGYNLVVWISQWIM